MKKLAYTILFFVFSFSLSAKLVVNTIDGSMSKFDTAAIDSVVIEKNSADTTKYNMVVKDRIFRRGTFAVDDIKKINFTKEYDFVCLSGDNLDLSAKATGSVRWATNNDNVTVTNGVVLASKVGCSVVRAYDDNDNETVFNIVVLAKSADVYRHGYTLLSDADKKIYDCIVRQIAGFKANGKEYGDMIYHRAYLDFSEIGSTPTLTKLRSIMGYIIPDWPEFFHIMTTPSRDYDRGQYYIRVLATFSPDKYCEAMMKIYKEAEDIFSEFQPSMSDYAKTKLIHDRYIDISDYGNMNGSNAGNLYGGLVDKRAVCEGLSRTMLFLSQQAGLKSIYISGSLLVSSAYDSWGNHAWNFNNVDGKWYLLDMTTDGAFPGYTNYDAFLKGKDYFDANYRLQDSTGGSPNPYSVIPELNDVGCDFE